MSTKTIKRPAKLKPEVSKRFNEDHLGEIISTKDVAFSRRRTSEHYIPLVQKVLGMKVGQSLPISVPEGSNIANFRATVAATLRKRTAGMLGKNRLTFGITGDNRLVVSIVPNKD